MRYVYFLCAPLLLCGCGKPEPRPFVPAIGASSTDEYREPEFEAKVVPYSVAPDFANVGNWETWRDTIADESRRLLQRNAFVVVRGGGDNLHGIYELNHFYYQHEGGDEMPSFVTVDSVLHSFHAFTNVLQRWIEDRRLHPEVVNMTKGMLSESVRQHESSRDPDMKAAALANIAFFLVPAKMLNVSTSGLRIPAEAVEFAAAEEKLIFAADGKHRSALQDMVVDYSQFKVRGHYTQTQRLTEYFRAMMWYGYFPLRVEAIRGQERGTFRAYLMGQAIKANPGGAGDSWSNIYFITEYMVGRSDDPDPFHFHQAVLSTTGPLTTTIDVSDTMRIIEATVEMRKPVITDVERGYRLDVQLMGQRATLDGYIHQQLAFPKVEERTMVNGLDVFSVLGSQTAHEILDNELNETKHQGYSAQTKKLNEWVHSLPAETWHSTMYNSWLDVLRRIIEPKGAGYPTFMQNEAWRRKSLSSAMASWSQLRHDTILYVKQPYVAQMGGDDEEEPKPRPPRGYVEPDVRAYHRLRFLLAQYSRELKRRGFLSEEFEEKFRDFDALLGRLIDISLKHLRNEEIDEDDELFIEEYGHSIAMLNLYERRSERGGEQWSELINEGDTDMATAADVFSDLLADRVLQCNVGRSDFIYAIFPARGKLWLGRGAVYSYYEMVVPLSERMTNESWRKRLDDWNNPPARPEWTRMYIGRSKWD